MRVTAAAVRRGAVGAVTLAVGFGAGFAITTSVADEDPARPQTPAVIAPGAPVIINNLERAPDIKPLRSAAGGLPPIAPESP